MAENLLYPDYKAAIARVLSENGLDNDQADLFADYLATADFYGVKTHGTATLNAHLERIRGGGYNLHPRFTAEREAASFAVIDGDNAIGAICACHCVDLAMRQAERAGAFTVFSHNNNTFGAAFHYALRAARNGFICFAASNAPAQMAPQGGRDKLLGSNPFSVAIPAQKHPPLIIDMASSAAAKSKLTAYAKNGRDLPQGWATDTEGIPTTDAQTALNGLLLPMAGTKGYGIATVIDLIAGLTSGAAYLDRVGRFYGNFEPMNVGFYFHVLSPRMIFGDGFYREADQYLQTLRASRSVDGKTVSLPGDDRLSAWNKNMKNGLPLEL